MGGTRRKPVHSGRGAGAPRPPARTVLTNRPETFHAGRDTNTIALTVVTNPDSPNKRAVALPRARLRVRDDAGAWPGVATGPGPRWLRRGLAGLAVLYFAALLHHRDIRWLRPVMFFTDATKLFPRASVYALEYRLEVWPCGRRWEPIDPRPYFPIEPDDKESRLQRLGYFYERNRTVMQALDDYLSAGHAAGADDGVAGRIGGIRLVKVVRPLPDVGQPVERYHFEPRAPIPPEQRRDVYFTPGPERKRRCEAP